MKSKILFILFLGICYAQGIIVETENLEYPCESTDDWDCIRDFLASTGQCNKVSHEDGEPIKEGDQYSYVPKLNVSIICKDSEINFFGSKILDFYLNKDTNNLVMSLDYDAVTLFTQKGLFYFERNRREPMIVEEYINITYTVTITVIIAWSDHIEVDDIRAYGYHKGLPIIEIGPKITNSSNEIVQQAFQGLLADIPSAMQELWLTKAYYYTCAFLRNMLCDFGYLYDGRINRD